MTINCKESSTSSQYSRDKMWCRYFRDGDFPERKTGSTNTNQINVCSAFLNEKQVIRQ